MPRSPFLRPRALLLALATVATLGAEPLSKKFDVDFYRDIPSRNLKGLATRSDGRLLAGPVLTELAGEAPADLLWSLAAGADASHWLVGTGPDGKIFELTIDPAKATASSRPLADLDESHVFALARLADGTILAGTSPQGALCLIKDGKVTARVALPVDSLFDLLVLDRATVLVATGNPGRIYQVDLAKFAAAGVAADKLTETKALADHGLTLFAEIRDRNVRRLVRLADGRIAAGSAPKGNLYAFAAPTTPAAAQPTPPVILLENRDAEITDILPTDDGGLFACVTYAGGAGESRITPPRKNTPSTPKGAPAPADNAPSTEELVFSSFASEKSFSGRGALISIPAHGFPEVVASRNNTAFYRLALHGDFVIVSGGEQGELIGYDRRDRFALTFPGSPASQLSGLAPLPGLPGRFLVLHNNAPGFALLDFAASAPRVAETRRLDLGGPSLFGALRFSRLREVPESAVAVSLKSSHGSDEIEGWSNWQPLAVADGGWSIADQRGRYFKLRLTLPAALPASAQLDKAGLYSLPQNRRPQLQDFHLLAPNFALVPSSDPSPQLTTTVGQLLQGKDDEPKRKSGFLNSQIAPAPGGQIALWNVTDPDGDNLVCTFSYRRDGDANWTDIARETHESYAQFDTSHLPDGVYYTRLIVAETDPRPVADRLSTNFETDDLIVDHTPPDFIAASAKLTADTLTVTVQGRDTLSLLDGVEAVFNNGLHEQTEQPADGIRDSREETFVLELPLAKVAGATSVEVILYDALGNTRAQRLIW